MAILGVGHDTGVALDALEVEAARCRYAVVERALHRRPELVHGVVSAVLAELPEYATGRSQADLDDILAGIGQSVDVCLVTMAGQWPREGPWPRRS